MTRALSIKAACPVLVGSKARWETIAGGLPSFARHAGAEANEDVPGWWPTQSRTQRSPRRARPCLPRSLAMLQTVGDARSAVPVAAGGPGGRRPGRPMRGSMSVFISYSHENSDYVGPLIQVLRSHRIDVRWDSTAIGLGDSIPERVAQLIRNVCHTFVIVVTPSAAKSHWVDLEYRIAQEREARDPEFRIIPVLLAGDVPPAFVRRRCCDVRSSHKAPAEFNLLLVTLLERETGSGGIASNTDLFKVPEPRARPPAPVRLGTRLREPNPLLHDLRAPMVGTFYRAVSPDAKPFVEVGSAVKETDSVCIIEAMKIENEIEAGLNGTIAEILVEHGSPVEYGDVLMRIK